MDKFTCPVCHAQEVSIAVYIPVSITWSAWILPETGEVFDGEGDTQGTPSQEPDDVVVRCVECETSFHAELERHENGYPAKVLDLAPIHR